MAKKFCLIQVPGNPLIQEFRQYIEDLPKGQWTLNAMYPDSNADTGYLSPGIIRIRQDQLPAVYCVGGEAKQFNVTAEQVAEFIRQNLR